MNTLAGTVHTVGELRDMLQGVPDDCPIHDLGGVPIRIELHSKAGVESTCRVWVSEGNDE